MQRPKLVPLASKERAIARNLPVPPTPLVGREQLVEAARLFLQRPEVRLLTLTGTAGVGKTRLALQVATELLDDFADGVYFVPLAPITDPHLVIPTIAHSLGLTETTNQPVLELLQTYVQDRHLLLLLDNFEQIITAAPLLAALLEACPDLKLLVTSREVLHLRAEQQFPVPPLSLPDLKQLPDTETFPRYTAIALFLQRAQATRPDFQLTTGNARTVADICIRLDGLPLAIELAAARIKVLSPQALLARLERRLQVLAGGARDLPERQQTLRNTIQWSYDLLGAEEQRIFRCLAVFVGGFMLEAAEAVFTAREKVAGDVFHAVTSLIDKSLVQQQQPTDAEPRLMLLETIREYGLECLAANEEMEVTRRAHAAYYLQLAEEAEPHFGGPEEAAWLDRLERELNNLRAAMQWAVEGGEAGESIETALRLVLALRRFWMVRSSFNEGRDVLKRALASSEGVAPLLHAQALEAAGMMAFFQDDFEQVDLLCRESLALYRELEHTPGIALSLFWLTSVSEQRGNWMEARQLMEEALALFKQVGNREYIAWSNARLATQLALQGEYTRARALREETLRRFREQGNLFGVAAQLNASAYGLFLSGGDPARVRSLAEEGLARARELCHPSLICQALGYLAELALIQDDAAGARSLIEKALEVVGELGDKEGSTWFSFLLGKVAVLQGDYAAALARYQEALAFGYNLYIPSCLEGVADMAARQAEFVWVGRLWGAAEALREAMGTPLPPVYRADYERAITAARKHLGEKAFAAAWAEGRVMTPEQAFAAREPLATPTPTLAEQSSPPPVRVRVTYPDGLTAREVEVLRLVAQGLKDTEVAERLIISPRTVHAHLVSIYSKLGITSRNAATRYAIEHKLT
jgi:predicted ATPase/DNA-binding CsgD family transcriptional regulator